jgi:GNAT superfamily N-acetyltransferase
MKDKLDYTVRGYRPEDRESVRYICCETGFMGDPMEVFFEGRDVFADMWSSYWTDYEPESCFIAKLDGKVVGYILGCTDTDRYERVFAKEIRPMLLRKALKQGTFLKRKNIIYLARVIQSHRRGEFRAPMRSIKAEYPAHLHNNIADPWLRGNGIGKALMNVYLDYLRDRDVRGVHLGTTSYNKQAVPFYEACGFEEIYRSRLTCYDHVIRNENVYLLYFARKI